MEKTIFIIEKDSRGKYYIVEGWKKPKQVFSVKRFICEVLRQETEEETRELAEFLLKKLKE